jgi:hypothetical protein
LEDYGSIEVGSSSNDEDERLSQNSDEYSYNDEIVDAKIRWLLRNNINGELEKVMEDKNTEN